MSEEVNASSLLASTSLDETSFTARLAGLWKNFSGLLLEPALRVSHKTANYTVLSSDRGTVFTNLGASATITFTLPTAVVGLHYRFQVRAASGTSWQLRVDPNGSEIIESTAVPRVAGSAGQYLWADAIGEHLHIVCMETGKWMVLDFTGTWTLA